MGAFAADHRTRTVRPSYPDTPVWRDKKRYLWPLGLLVPLSPFAAWFLVEKLSLGLFWAFGAWLIVIVVPLVDLVAGEDGNSPPDEKIPELQEDRFYRWCTYLFLPLQYVGLVFACWCWVNSPMASGEKFALAMTAGVVAGVGINAAHEMGHKSEKFEKWLAKIALAQSFYGHFVVEHNHGHHVRVATAEDPASSRYRENFWFFLPRSVFGGLRSGWQIERARLKRQGVSTWSYKNNILNSWVMSVTLFAVLIVIFGWEIAPWLAVQAVAGFTFLETVNYLEHYGLLRAKRSDGSYVRCSPEDSWNSDHVVSNLFLYQLQRHSDHHANPLLRYQSLRSAQDAPQLPAGYAVMIVCAWVPPLWRTIMDKRLLDYYSGDMSRVNAIPGNAIPGAGGSRRDRKRDNTENE